MNDIVKPRDAQEARAGDVSGRITKALGVIGSVAVTLSAGVISGIGWLTDHLPLLLTGLASFVSSLCICYVAIRRMAVDRMEVKNGKEKTEGNGESQNERREADEG